MKDIDYIKMKMNEAPEKKIYDLRLSHLVPIAGFLIYTQILNECLDNQKIKLGSTEDFEFLGGQAKLLFYNSFIGLASYGLERLLIRH